jgi:2-alkyl-3-oxoalkanoate reductase
MRLFVTGGTGALGRPVLGLLTERGHAVRALARDERADDVVRELGAEPVRGDVFDPESLGRGVAGCEAVLHLATRIPPGRHSAELAEWAENDRIRTEGTRSVVDAALAAGVSVLVYPSVVYVYPDRGDEWVDAATPTDAAGPARSTLAAEQEVARLSERGGRGVVLRMGMFIGPSAASSMQLLAAAAEGHAVLAGPDGAYQPAIWMDDAAEAMLAAVERAPAGVYDVVDDEPLTRAELGLALAAAAGRPGPLIRPNPPTGPVVEVLSRSLRVSNRRFKEATGWAPTVPNAREALRRLAGR